MTSKANLAALVFLHEKKFRKVSKDIAKIIIDIIQEFDLLYIRS